jgi:Chaperone of endosialidase
MPRNGSGIYAHPFPDVVEGTTIESAVFNGNTSDVEQDLNAPRPIVAGGTGAANAHDARIALGAEVSGQQVTNYDMHVFENGSFYSQPGVTAAPEATAWYSGIAYTLGGNPDYITLEASEYGGTPWRRVKSGGVWQPWKQQVSSVADLDARYVNVAGDTMSGGLTAPGFIATAANVTSGYSGTGGTYYFGSAGTNYLLYDGTSNYFAFSTAAASTVIASAYAANGAITAGRSGAAGTYFFGNTGTKYLAFDGTNFSLNGGALHVNSDIYADSGVIRFNNNVGIYLYNDGTKFILSGGDLNASGLNIGANGIATTGGISAGAGGLSTPGSVVASGNVSAGGTVYCSGAVAGAGSAVGQYVMNGGTGAGGGGNLVWQKNSTSQWIFGNYSSVYGGANTSSDLLLYSGAAGPMCQYQFDNVRFTAYGAAYKPGGGAWADSSDARIKNELGEYTRGLAEIAALRPVYYTFKGNDTSDEPSHARTGSEEENAKVAELPLVVPYPNSAHNRAAVTATKYAGLIAQEVELIIPEMVTKRSAFIDGQPVDDLRDLDTTPLIFALVNAVKELKAEIDALKAAR